MVLIYLELSFALEQLIAENNTYRCPALRGRAPAHPWPRPILQGGVGGDPTSSARTISKLNLSQPQLVLVANYCPAGALPAPALQVSGHGGCVCDHQ